VKINLLLLILLSVLVGCGKDKTTVGARPKEPKRILTESEKERLVTPTIYYTPEYSEAELKACSESEKVDIKDDKNKTIVSACKKIYLSCRLQGSCKLVVNGKTILINVGKIVDNVRRFKIISNSKCIYGWGSTRDSVTSFKEMCLDPFYSVAADLKIYNLGDVVYLPALVGTLLPNNEFHSGYFIVRDSGNAIKGKGRFDFFTGNIGLKKTDNPFARLGLGGGKFFPEYYVLSSQDGAAFKKERGFPSLQD
jgi:3D (Asp-Asp-Asp) domain-containing protein